jgi:hypothetical protein
VTAPQRPSLPRLTGPGEALAWIAGLLLAVSAFTGWYASDAELVTVAVIGWHTGTFGKLVFFAGVAVLALLVLRATGLELPPAFPVGAAVASIGALASIFVLIRLIDIPDRFLGAGRGVGIWISLAASLAVVAAGLLQASEEVNRPAQ